MKIHWSIRLILVCSFLILSAHSQPAQAFCGNDVCEPGEDCFSCPNDCISGVVSPYCGDGICQTASSLEDCRNCPEDCNGVLNGNPSGRFCCGEGDGVDPLGCGDQRCNAGGFECVQDSGYRPFCCGDGRCDVAENGTAENSARCALDCGDDVGPCLESGAACDEDRDCCSRDCRGKKCRPGIINE